MSQPQDSERIIQQLDRIESKLDALLNALAEEEAAEDITHDLDGNPVPGSRPDHEEL